MKDSHKKPPTDKKDSGKGLAVELAASPRILAIHDLAGFSRTSLMAVIPIMTQAGITVCALPTAILSSNTEQAGFQMLDMTAHLGGFIRQWSDLKLSFAAIYSGFLASERQVDLVLQALDVFHRETTLVVVDPVMGDNGSLYPCFDAGIVTAMQKLVCRADVITPNVTEAALLLQQKYPPALAISTAQDWCIALSESGPRYVCITGIAWQQKTPRNLVIAYDRLSRSFHSSSCPYLPVSYPGTGDIFTAVSTAHLLRGIPFAEALNQAVQFVYQALQISIQTQTPEAEGICLEKALRYL